MSFATVTTLIPTNATDASFRAWGSAIAAKLNTAGWVQTSDSGQINWSTVLAPTAAETSKGYEIWRMADSLQSSTSVYMKLEYGSGLSASSPSLWITIGGGSNGSGGLIGSTTVRQQIKCSATATPVNAYWSGDTNRFVFALPSTASSSFSLLLSIERTRDSNGNFTTEGVTIIVHNNGNWAQVAWSKTNGVYTAWETSSMGALGPTALGVKGNKMSVFPVLHSNGMFLPPGMNVMAYINAYVMPYAPISFTMYGSTRTFMPLGPQWGNYMTQRNTGGAIMVRYE